MSTSSAEEKLRAASGELSQLLAVSADGAIDLTQLKEPAVALTEAVQAAYFSTLEPFLADLTESPAATSALRRLMERQSRLEADLFILKSCLVKHHRFVFGEANRFKDPLATVLEEIRGFMAAPLEDDKVVRHLTVPLGESVLGHGWYPVKTTPERTPYRWSGPATRSSLVLPALGFGKHRLSAVFDVVDRSQMDSIGVRVNGVEAHDLSVKWISDVTGEIAFVTPEIRATASFLYIEFQFELMLPESGRDSGPKVGIRLSSFAIDLIA